MVFVFTGHMVSDRKRRRVEAPRRRIGRGEEGEKTVGNGSVLYEEMEKIQAKIIAKVFGKGRNFTTFATLSKYYT